MTLHVGKGRGFGHGNRKPQGSGPPPFSPLSLFGAGQKGGWWEADPAAMYQGTTTGTTAAAQGAVVGYVRDKSGNGNHATQATSSQRPLYQQTGGKNYLAYDQTDDWLGAAFAAGTYSATMDVMLAVRRIATQAVPLNNAYSGGNFLGAVQSGGQGDASNSSGAPTYYINGVAVPMSGGTFSNRNDMDLAWPAGTPVILEIRGADLSAWNGFGFGDYPGFAGVDRVYGCVARQTMTATERDNLRTYLPGLYQ